MMQFLANRRTAFREHIATLAMTNLRIYCTLMMTTLTGVVYLGVAVARLALAAAGKPVAGGVWGPPWGGRVVFAPLGGGRRPAARHSRASQRHRRRPARAAGRLPRSPFPGRRTAPS